MFGSSSPFGQSASTPFGSQSPFGQNNVTNNPFAPKPFGANNPFGSPTGGSIFGSNSTGMFGQPSAQPSSTPAFGAASSQAFGSSTPAFGSQSSSFGGSSAFGQKPFGGFGSGNTQTSPFGSSSQQSQPAFGSNIFGSTAPFGAPSQPSFGATNTPAFGSTTPSFGSTNTPGFGATSTPAFGSTPSPSFGSTGTAFGAGSTPGFGSANTPAFGATSTSAFGSTSTPPFGAASTPAFGQISSQTFGNSSGPTAFGGSTSSFSFNSNTGLGQSTTPFGSSGFGQGSSGAQTTTTTFGSSAFGQPNLGGSRVPPYQATADTTDGANQGKLESISAMLPYKDKSHEELRWEDYHRGDKGGPNAAGQSTSVLGSGVPGTAFGNQQTFGQPSANIFSTPTSSTQSNVFAPNSSPFGSTGFAPSTPAFGSSPFAPAPAPATTTSLFGSTPTQTSSPFGPSTPAFTSSPVFGTPSSSATVSASVFGPAPGQGQPSFATSAFGSQSSPLFQSSSPSLGMGSSSLGQTNSLFGPPTFNTAFNTSSSFVTSGFPSFATGGQTSFGQTTPSLATPLQAGQSNSPFNFNNAGQTLTGGTPGIFGQNPGQLSGNQSSAVLQPVAITNPFGTLPAMPHMSIGNTGTSPSIQYGISSMPIVDKPAPVRVSSLLTTRHLSQRRIRLPARKYHPKNDGSRVAFFSEEDEAPSTPKADALFVPRENPRALIIRPVDQLPKSSRKEASVLVCEDGKTFIENQHHLNGSIAGGINGIANGNGSINHQNNPVKSNQKPNCSSDGTPNQKGDSYIVYEHEADMERTMPKLRHSDYYTEPQIQGLAAKERAEPGYCRHVNDFVVGRHGYGSIEFLGKTDVRGLDLESVIQFNDREVIVYLDDSKKPPVGQGLNKPAEVTLLNIKYIDRKTGEQIVEGPKIEKYKEMLKKKADNQGAEFLSYDPVKAEWKFRVDHFSKYALGNDDHLDSD